MYKLSKYNFYTLNKKQQLLLFNTLSGQKSFIKISQENASFAKEVFSSDRPISDFPEHVQDQLANLGYIVQEEVDEDDFLKIHYLEKVNNSILHLTILPTEQCNFRCKYCYESFPDTYMTQDTQDSVIKYLYKNLNKYSGLHISWFGGEPLEGLPIIENISRHAMQLCRTLKKPYTASITTNGYNLSLDVFRLLLKYNVLYYQITIDGVKKIHDFQRPHRTDLGSTYDKIICNLTNIRDAVKTKVFRIIIRSNFSTDNLYYITEYKKNFSELFSQDKRFQFDIRPIMNFGGERIGAFSDQLINSNDFSKIYEMILNSDEQLFFAFDDFLKCGTICYAGQKNSYVITSNGSVFKCTCNYANVPQSKIGEISSDGSMLINEWKQARWVCKFSGCGNKDCFYKPICFGDACSSIRILEKGAKPCPIERKNLHFILQILDKDNNIFKECIFNE